MIISNRTTVLVAACAAFALAVTLLSGCDLEEARRTDFDRHGVHSIRPDVRRATFLGRERISIDSLLGVAAKTAPSSVWDVEYVDPGSPVANQWLVRGWVGDSLVFQARSSSGTWAVLPKTAAILRDPGELRTEFVLIAERWVESDDSWGYGHQAIDTVGRLANPIPVVVDVNRLRWDTAFAHRTVRPGDTLRLPVRVERGDPGSDKTISVYAEYHGVRTLGDYLRKLGPGSSDTLAWEVTAPAGDTISIDLVTGSWGAAAHFGFRVSP